jgi:hypothetical protein
MQKCKSTLEISTSNNAWSIGSHMIIPHIEYFDFVEFVLQKNENKLSIITSAYSDNGNFLLNKLKTKKERLEENFCKNDYIVVEL